MAHHTPMADLASVSISELCQRFADRWTIVYEPAPAVWSAEQRSADGHQLRFICDKTPAGLAGKLAVAEARQ